MYLLVGRLGAGTCVDFLQNSVFGSPERVLYTASGSDMRDDFEIGSGVAAIVTDQGVTIRPEGADQSRITGRAGPGDVALDRSRAPIQRSSSVSDRDRGAGQARRSAGATARTARDTGRSLAGHRRRAVAPAGGRWRRLARRRIPRRGRPAAKRGSLRLHRGSHASACKRAVLPDHHLSHCDPPGLRPHQSLCLLLGHPPCAVAPDQGRHAGGRDDSSRWG